MALAVPRRSVPGHVVYGRHVAGHAGDDRLYGPGGHGEQRYLQRGPAVFGQLRPVRGRIAGCLFGSRGLRVLCGLADEQVRAECPGRRHLQQRSPGHAGGNRRTSRGRLVYYCHGSHQHPEFAEPINHTGVGAHAPQHVVAVEELQDFGGVKKNESKTRQNKAKQRLWRCKENKETPEQQCRRKVYMYPARQIIIRKQLFINARVVYSNLRMS
mmetsp:Transcript_28416/g.76969  ORF Transcript_28416/g.76969 Transcript_28416/m.76969 type:complete len:213 (+) Transcript_28416:2224-2862(+)